MKIGILTFHSQLNYGGVLQCWALKEALKDMGHEVVVIDRWLTPDNSLLLGPLARKNARTWIPSTRLNSTASEGPLARKNARTWIGLVLRGVLGCGQFSALARRVRTIRFVKKLGLTPYHFYDWKDASKNLGVDCLVVGSDQVWHGGDWGDPAPYLLEGAPEIPAIAYATSFGMKALPIGIDYAAGFKRFRAISVREEEGVSLVASTGYLNSVQHVVDPTLLLPQAAWGHLRRWSKVPRRLVCYLLEEDISAALPVLEKWARENDWTVEVVCDGFLKPLPKSGRAIFVWLREMFAALVSPPRVRVRTAFGPREFVRAFAQADACITDSFHAVMFSSIYKLNARFLRPTNESRKAMFTRIEEFAVRFIRGSFVASDLPSALDSLVRDPRMAFDEPALDAQRASSAAWLKTALKSVQEKL